MYRQMAVCKRCGCAMPMGSKVCDMCSVYGAGAVAPVQQPWQPPKEAAGASELATSAATWATVPGAVRPSSDAALLKARKQVRRAARYFAVIGGLSVALGALSELLDWTAVLAVFNWFTVAEGAIFLALAYFARTGSLVAVGTGAGLYLLDTIALLVSGHFSIIRVFILVALARGVLAANVLRQQSKATVPESQSRAA
jgi:hypothetical protein